MFARRYFAGRTFPPRYFGMLAGVPSVGAGDFFGGRVFGAGFFAPRYFGRTASGSPPPTGDGTPFGRYFAARLFPPRYFGTTPGSTGGGGGGMTYTQAVGAALGMLGALSAQGVVSAWLGGGGVSFVGLLTGLRRRLRFRSIFPGADRHRRGPRS